MNEHIWDLKECWPLDHKDTNSGYNGIVQCIFRLHLGPSPRRVAFSDIKSDIKLKRCHILGGQYTY